MAPRNIMNRNSPIGIFDSGLGGLTVVRELTGILPHENLIYLGDTARVPYGTRSPETIKKFSVENTNFLLKKKVKCIIIACNTSSAVAAGYLKSKFKKVPIFEVISSASKEAMLKGKRIGVIGTRATIASGAYGAAKYQTACPLLVPFIEEGELKSEALRLILRKYLAPLKKAKVDTLILGCTHYPIIKGLIQKEMGEKVRLINPEKTVAREVRKFLEESGGLSLQKEKGKKEFYATDLTSRFIKVAEMFLGHKIHAKLTKI